MDDITKSRKITRFEDIEVWQVSREMAGSIYRLTLLDNFERDWGLRDQIRRAAVSTMANIAEGFERGSRKDFILFLRYSIASAAEVKSHLYLALDLGYINMEQFKMNSDQIDSICRQIKGFIKYLRKSDHE
jgi:four helix bundle protein